MISTLWKGKSVKRQPFTFIQTFPKSNICPSQHISGLSHKASKSSHTIWCERSHHLIRALTPYDVSDHIIWCEITFLGIHTDFVAYAIDFAPLPTQHIQKYSSQTEHPSCRPHARLRQTWVREWRVKVKMPNFIQLYAYARVRKSGAGKMSQKILTNWRYAHRSGNHSMADGIRPSPAFRSGTGRRGSKIRSRQNTFSEGLKLPYDSCFLPHLPPIHAQSMTTKATHPLVQQRQPTIFTRLICQQHDAKAFPWKWKMSVKALKSRIKSMMHTN